MNRILVVDDEQDVKILFEQRFRREIRKGEMDFVFAFSGKEALSIMENNWEKTDFILSDINMPGMTGLELLKHVKRIYEKPPPVMMMITAYGDQDNFNLAKELGADDFLTKPVDFTLLKEKLKAHLL